MMTMLVVVVVMNKEGGDDYGDVDADHDDIIACTVVSSPKWAI